MNGSKLESDDRLKRHERLRYLHEILVQLVMNEGRFISERTNNFLLFNSILFTGFLLLSIQIDKINAWIIVLKVALPTVGLVMTILHSISIARTIDAADFWRSSIGLIEEDPDFWYPTKAERDADLDVFKARCRYLEGIQTRQQHHALRLSQPPSFVKKLSRHLPDPNRIFVFWLPFLIGILWLLALIWSLLPLSNFGNFVSFN
jgi:hypothetical protein